MKNMTLVLTGVAVIMGAILAFVNDLTSGPIQEQKSKALADGIKTVLVCDDCIVTQTDTVRQTDAKGRKIKVHKLPIPDVPVCCTQEDIDNYVFEPGEDEREAGERLAASYVNFYFANDYLLVPQFGGDNKSSDERAVKILKDILPEKEVVPIDARSILLGGGNIHCITQQIPMV